MDASPAEKYQAFLRWRASPAAPGEPQNLTEYAKSRSLSADEVRSFVERPTYHTDLLAAALLWAKSKVPQLLHDAFERAKDARGKTSDAEKFMQLVIELDKAQKAPDRSPQAPGTTNFIFNVDDTKLRELTERIARRTGVLDRGGPSGPALVRDADQG